MVAAGLRLTNRNAAVILGVLSLLYLASTTYTPLNGTHTWRQADAFAQILSLLGAKGMTPLQLFNQPATMFDTPIYEWLAAALTRVSGSDPIVAARLINDLFWCLFLWTGYRVVERITHGAGLLFVLLAATSPLFLQYFAAPIPDGMAVALSVGAIDLLTDRLTAPGIIGATLLLITAALIKSPIPFTFLSFFITRVLVVDLASRGWRGVRPLLPTVLPLGAAVAATVGAELLRKTVSRSTPDQEAATLTWYFGTETTRTQLYYWQTMLDRTTASFASPLLVAGVLLALGVLFACSPRDFLHTVVPPAVGFFAGWLVFANVFLLHDYYEMGVTTLVMFGAASTLVMVGRRVGAAVRDARPVLVRRTA